jgi:ribonuclease P/MRP protein subunit RPP40
VSNDLKWHYQVFRAARKANQITGMILNAFKTREPNTIKTLYTTYIRPHLEFAVSIWSPYLEKDIKVLESVQHRVIKAIKGYNSLEYLEKLDKLGLTTLDVRRRRGDLIQAFKILKGIEKVDLNAPVKLAPSLASSGPAGSLRGIK